MSSVTRYRCKAATTRAHGCIRRLKRRRSMIRVRIERVVIFVIIIVVVVPPALPRRAQEYSARMRSMH